MQQTCQGLSSYLCVQMYVTVSVCFKQRTNTQSTLSATKQTNKLYIKTVFLLQYVFVSFLSRDNTYKILMSVCRHLEVGQTSHMLPYLFHQSLLLGRKPAECKFSWFHWF